MGGVKVLKKIISVDYIEFFSQNERVGFDVAISYVEPLCLTIISLFFSNRDAHTAFSEVNQEFAIGTSDVQNRFMSQAVSIDDIAKGFGFGGVDKPLFNVLAH